MYGRARARLSVYLMRWGDVVLLTRKREREGVNLGYQVIGERLTPS